MARWSPTTPTSRITASYRRVQTANLLRDDAGLRAVAGLPAGPRRAQLLRHARDVFLRLLQPGQPAPDSDHPSGDRPRLHVQAAGPRRRGQPAQQPDQPEPRSRLLRSDQSQRRRPTACARSPAPIRLSRPSTTACCAASPAPTRASRREASWRRTIVDRYGQMFTPFVSARVDFANVEIQTEPGVSNFIKTGRDRRRTRHADRRSRIPLSLHQRAVVGHADDRADRADHRAPERDRRSARCPTRTSQSLIFDASNLFRVEQVCRLGPRRGRRPPERRRQLHRAVQSRRLRQRDVRAVLSACSGRTRSRSAARPIPASRAASTPPAPTTWRGWPTSRTRRSR